MEQTGTTFGPLGKLPKQRLLDTLEERFDTAAKHREPFEKCWYNNIDFLMGRQWVVWDSRLKQLNAVSDDDEEIEYVKRRVHNITASTQEALIAHITRSDPQPSCEPRTGEPEDASVARVCLALEKWMFETLDWREKHLDFLQWLFTCDFCFYKWGWDATRSPFTPDGLAPTSLLTSLPDDIESRMRVGLLKQQKKSEIKASVKQGLKAMEDAQPIPFLGDIFLDVVNPLEMFLEPNATSFDTARWFFHAVAIPRSEAIARFGDRLAEKMKVAEVSGSHFAGFSRERYAGSSIAVGEETMIEDESTFDQSEDYVYVPEYWERPSPDYPQGRRILWIGDEVKDGPIPGNTGRPPFGVVSYSKVLGRYSGQSLVEKLKPIQISYNRIISTIDRHLKFFGLPKIGINRLSTKGVSRWTDLPGEFVNYSGTAPPAFIVPPNLPREWFDYLQILRNDAFEVAGLHSLSRGEYPPIQHALPGVAIQLLQERDDARLTPLFKRLDKVLSQAALGLLSIIRDHYPEEAIEAIVGRFTAQGYEDTDIPAVSLFKQSNLIQQFDIRMRTVSGLPDSPAAKRQLIFDMFQAGLFGPPQDPITAKRVRSLLEFPVDEKMFQDDQTLSEQIQAMISQRMQGGGMPEGGGMPPQGAPI